VALDTKAKLDKIYLLPSAEYPLGTDYQGRDVLLANRCTAGVTSVHRRLNDGVDRHDDPRLTLSGTRRASSAGGSTRSSSRSPTSS
jgi:hypothetical protein